MGPRSPTSPNKPKTPTFPDFHSAANSNNTAAALKPCAVCELPRSVLIRCQIDASGDWVYVCPVVCLARVGGVGPGNDGTKVGLYGGGSGAGGKGSSGSGGSGSGAGGENQNPYYRFGGLWNADKAKGGVGDEGEEGDGEVWDAVMAGGASKGRGKKLGAVKGVKARSLSWDDGTMGKGSKRQGRAQANGDDADDDSTVDGSEVSRRSTNGEKSEGGGEDEDDDGDDNDGTFKERDREPRRMKRRLSRKQRNTKFEDSFAALTTWHDEEA